jgi:hypothetical protein
MRALASTIRILGDIAPRFLQPPAVPGKEQSGLWGIKPGEMQYPPLFQSFAFLWLPLTQFSTTNQSTWASSLGTAFGVSLNNNVQKDDPAATTAVSPATPPRMLPRIMGRSKNEDSEKAGHAVKYTSKKATHKTAQKTNEGAQKIEDKTNPNHDPD